jgi:hypothetical protein
MEFDRVIQVIADGTVVECPDLHAPEVHVYEQADGTWDDDSAELGDWHYFTTGYSGQDRYNGPHMHSSEYIGGRLARDILSTPGIYAAVAIYGVPLDDTEDMDADSWAVVWIPPSEEVVTTCADQTTRWRKGL